MPESHATATRFETHRPHLLAVATRLLGSTTEAEDAVQEAWLRLDRTGETGIENLGGWLTTVVARICLDMLRSRGSRREEPLAPESEVVADVADPEHEAMLAESVGVAMQTVLQRLGPAERVAFVLHDVFGVPFDEIAGIVDRSPATTRQLASRARRRVQGAPVDGQAEDGEAQRQVVEAFFRASRGGDVHALLAVLDPNVMLRADEVALRMGTRTGWLTSDLQGAEDVARQFSGRAEAARMVTINGEYGGAWVTGGTPHVVFRFVLVGDRIATIALVADPEAIAGMDIAIFDVQNDQEPNAG